MIVARFGVGDKIVDEAFGPTVYEKIEVMCLPTKHMPTCHLVKPLRGYRYN